MVARSTHHPGLLIRVLASGQHEAIRTVRQQACGSPLGTAAADGWRPCGAATTALARSAAHFQSHRTQGWCEDGACLAQVVASLTQGATEKTGRPADEPRPHSHATHCPRPPCLWCRHRSRPRRAGTLPRRMPLVTGLRLRRTARPRVPHGPRRPTPARGGSYQQKWGYRLELLWRAGGFPSVSRVPRPDRAAPR